MPFGLTSCSHMNRITTFSFGILSGSIFCQSYQWWNRTITHYMNFTHPCFYVVTITGMLIFGTSCHGQSQNMPSPEVYLKPRIALPDTSIGEIVKELSHNLMLVYHDKKNNYWFGSWVDGLYKYDGKKIIQYLSLIHISEPTRPY